MGFFSALFNRESPEEFMKRTFREQRLNYMDFLTEYEYNYISGFAERHSVEECQADKRTQQFKRQALARQSGAAPKPDEGYFWE